eukprot:GDKI01011962.1.p1 GENE.GDKI01011962.1~~GDKI01011962.1.p1  ORF type:complete len:127 (-),score=1.68 GDKI01011962.1:8-388(-)
MSLLLVLLVVLALFSHTNVVDGQQTEAPWCLEDLGYKKRTTRQLTISGKRTPVLIGNYGESNLVSAQVGVNIITILLNEVLGIAAERSPAVISSMSDSQVVQLIAGCKYDLEQEAPDMLHYPHNCL